MDTVRTSSGAARKQNNGTQCIWEGVLEQPREIGVLQTLIHVVNDPLPGINRKRP